MSKIRDVLATFAHLLVFNRTVLLTSGKHNKFCVENVSAPSLSESQHPSIFRCGREKREANRREIVAYDI